MRQNLTQLTAGELPACGSHEDPAIVATVAVAVQRAAVEFPLTLRRSRAWLPVCLVNNFLVPLDRYCTLIWRTLLIYGI